MSRKPRKCRICRKNPVWRGGDVKDPGPFCKRCYHKKVWPERKAAKRALEAELEEIRYSRLPDGSVQDSPPLRKARKWEKKPPGWLVNAIEESPAWLNELGITSDLPPLDQTTDDLPPPWLADLAKDLPDPWMDDYVEEVEEPLSYWYRYDEYAFECMLDGFYANSVFEDSPPHRLLRRWGNQPPRWLVDAIEEPPAWLNELAADSTPPPLDLTRDESPPPWLNTSVDELPPPWPDDEARETPFVWPYPIPGHDWWQIC